ncbi:hypothetical protein EXS66_02130 [Candidatus Saccharibacteria bacterium]|nr:hypothetical protein [Candidatus Saccharibacteria bacterium]
MSILISSLVGKKVFSVHDGACVAVASSWLINKDNLKIEIIIVKLVGNNSERYILTSDILMGLPGHITIRSQDDIMETEDLIRQRELIKSKYTLLGAKVMTRSGVKVGTVKDFAYDLSNWHLTKMHIRAGFPQRILQASLIIDRSAVIEVKGSTVIVKDSCVRAKVKAKTRTKLNTKRTAVKVLPA